jgi:hypothetical protein
MAPHGCLTAAQEAIGTKREHCGSHSDGTALMISLGLWIAATGIVALSFECLGAALVLFGIAGWLLS